MLSDNIKKHRKENNMSQDELAEKLGVSRQSVSLWETGQTQPTVDNIIALGKIFHVSADALLGGESDAASAPETAAPATDASAAEPAVYTNKKKYPLLIGVLVFLIIAAICTGAILLRRKPAEPAPAADASDVMSQTQAPAEQTQTLPEQAQTPAEQTQTPPEQTQTPPEQAQTPSEQAQTPSEQTQTPPDKTQTPSEQAQTPPEQTQTPPKQTQTPSEQTQTPPKQTQTPEKDSSPASSQGAEADLFEYCKNFAIQKGTTNGDYSAYSQESTVYGGYPNEFFSITYWSDSNMVEFCLHCPLSDTQSHNFYLRMRGGFDGTYEYCSSKYWREDGVSIRQAGGKIDPSVFFDGYPIPCDYYTGDTNGQTEFMEQTRVGICDLIRCLKKFTEVEKTDCTFAAFGFKNF